MTRCGNNLALLGAAGWATRLGGEVGALARVSQLDACSACCLWGEAGSDVFGLWRKLDLLQFAEVSVGDTVIPTHWPSLPTRKIS